MIALAQPQVKKALEETIKTLLYVDLSPDDIRWPSRLGGGSNINDTATELTMQLNKILTEETV